MKFADPYVLLLLLLVPLVVLYCRRRRPGGSLHFSSCALPAAAGVSLRQRLIDLPLYLRALALGLFIIALARPQQGLETVRDITHGIAIQMVVDHSGSMRAEMDLGGRRMTRLDAVREVFGEFIFGNKKSLSGRPNDLVGMIAFARFPDTLCPLTLAHDTLKYFIGNLRLIERRDEDGTAIGDALALAAARLKTAEETLSRQQGDRDRSYEVKSKIIILLTDGENNMGNMTPAEAVELTKKWGIKVYAIGVGGDEVVQMQTFFGTQTVKTGRGVDKKTLQEIADKSGGKFWLAEDGNSLRQVYEEIDRLEKTEMESTRYIDYKEDFMIFVLAGMALLCLDVILQATILRRLP